VPQSEYQETVNKAAAALRAVAAAGALRTVAATPPATPPASPAAEGTRAAVR
jgi:anthranilate synthase component 1